MGRVEMLARTRRQPIQRGWTIPNCEVRSQSFWENSEVLPGEKTKRVVHGVAQPKCVTK